MKKLYAALLVLCIFAGCGKKGKTNYFMPLKSVQKYNVDSFIETNDVKISATCYKPRERKYVRELIGDYYGLKPIHLTFENKTEKPLSINFASFDDRFIRPEEIESYKTRLEEKNYKSKGRKIARGAAEGAVASTAIAGGSAMAGVGIIGFKGAWALGTVSPTVLLAAPIMAAIGFGALAAGGFALILGPLVYFGVKSGASRRYQKRLQRLDDLSDSMLYEQEEIAPHEKIYRTVLFKNNVPQELDFQINPEGESLQQNFVINI